MDEQTGSPKKSKKRKASQNLAVVAHNGQAVPNQPAQPPARKPYNGTAPLCNQCSLHHHASVKCHKCQICGLIGHTARVCPTTAVPNQTGPIRVATPPAKKQYKGTAPICDKCNGHHQAHLQCRLCVSCGRICHLASACRCNPNQGGPNQPQADSAQARFSPRSCYNCGEMGHFLRDCPKLAKANLTHG